MNFVHVAVARAGVSLGNPVHSLEVESTGKNRQIRKDCSFTLLSPSEPVNKAKAWVHAQSMGVSYSDRNLPSFTDHAVLHIINILNQYIAGNLLGSIK